MIRLFRQDNSGSALFPDQTFKRIDVVVSAGNDTVTIDSTVYVLSTAIYGVEKTINANIRKENGTMVNFICTKMPPIVPDPNPITHPGALIFVNSPDETKVLVKLSLIDDPTTLIDVWLRAGINEFAVHTVHDDTVLPVGVTLFEAL